MYIHNYVYTYVYIYNHVHYDITAQQVKIILFSQVQKYSLVAQLFTTRKRRYNAKCGRQSAKTKFLKISILRNRDFCAAFHR